MLTQKKYPIVKVFSRKKVFFKYAPLNLFSRIYVIDIQCMDRDAWHILLKNMCGWMDGLVKCQAGKESIIIIFLLSF